MAIEQLSNPLVFMSFFQDSSGLGASGVTVTVDVDRVVNNSGTPSITSLITGAAATELGKGYYAYVLSSASVGVEGEYIATFKTTNVSVRDRHLPSLWSVNVAGVEHLDADISDIVAGVVGSDNISIIANGVDYRFYGDQETLSLGASVDEINVPNLATGVMVQVKGANAYITTDDSEPTSTHGWTIYDETGWSLLNFNEYKPDSLKVLRSAGGATLNYHFLRPQR